MKFKMAATAELSLTLDPMGKMFQNASSLKPLGQSFMYSLALIIFVVSEKKAFEHFPIGTNVNLCIAVAASLTLDPKGKMFQNASSLKPLGQLTPNCPGMIIGMFFTKLLFFMPIGNPRWPPLEQKT
jgi:hypothetical protein